MKIIFHPVISRFRYGFRVEGENIHVTHLVDVPVARGTGENGDPYLPDLPPSWALSGVVSVIDLSVIGKGKAYVPAHTALDAKEREMEVPASHPSIETGSLPTACFIGASRDKKGELEIHLAEPVPPMPYWRDSEPQTADAVNAAPVGSVFSQSSPA